VGTVLDCLRQSLHGLLVHVHSVTNSILTRPIPLGFREEKHGRFAKLPQFPRISAQSHATNVYKGPIPPPFSNLHNISAPSQDPLLPPSPSLSPSFCKWSQTKPPAFPQEYRPQREWNKRRRHESHHSHHEPRGATEVIQPGT